MRSRIPINDVNTVHALTKHLVAFLGLKELARKFGLVDFDIKLTIAFTTPALAAIA